MAFSKFLHNSLFHGRCPPHLPRGNRAGIESVHRERDDVCSVPKLPIPDGQLKDGCLHSTIVLVCLRICAFVYLCVFVFVRLCIHVFVNLCTCVPLYLCAYVSCICVTVRFGISVVVNLCALQFQALYVCAVCEIND